MTFLRHALPRSLRGRLLIWYALVVAGVTALFGATVCYVFWRSLLAEVDAELVSITETISGSLRPFGRDAFDLELPDEALARFQQPESGTYYAIWSAAGALVDASDPQAAAGTAVAGVRTREGRRELAVPGPAGATILVGRELSEAGQALRSLAFTVAGAGLLALGLSIGGGWFLAGRALAPIGRIDRTARAMAGGDLRARIAVEQTESELGQVAAALNSAFDRLDDERERQRRFTADASHELRTPLATILVQLEWALSRERSIVEYRESAETCQRAGRRMRGIVEGLLTLARADAGELRLAAESVRVERLLDDVVAILRPLAERRHVTLAVRSDAAEVRGDFDRLRDALTNVVTNAVQYAQDGGRVEVTAARADGGVTFRVVDDGPGIAAADLPHVFDRFYRGDKARSANGGAGLGLAIARSIVERHGGTIACSSEPGRTEFAIRLPAMAASETAQGTQKGTEVS